jgi:drug/metabolite transporter (DMT)-like permease
MIDFVESDTCKPFIIPIIGLLAGFVMMTVPKVATAGKLVLYFGAQSFMNIFMGWVFRTHVTVAKGPIPGSSVVLKEDLHGCPVGFALTAMQQLISFFCFLILYAALYATPYKITPKKISSIKEVVSILIFGCVFAMNIALNNFSLGYISIAVNLIIRSCLPLTTYLSQQGLAMIGLYTFKPCKAMEIGLMVAGVFCACAFTWAKIMGSGAGHKGQTDHGKQVMGCIVCLLSLLCGSVNLALAGVLGEMKLSVYDTVAYMSIPAFIFLIPFCLVKKPVPGEWPQVLGMDTASDFDIMMMTRQIAPSTFELFILSGFFSFAYNIIQFKIVHELSPSATAFGGNFNKAALVFLTLLLPFLQVHSLPPAPWNIIIWAAVLGNVAAFSYYSYLQILAKQAKAAEEAAKSEDKAENDKSQAMLLNEDNKDEAALGA